MVCSCGETHAERGTRLAVGRDLAGRVLNGWLNAAGCRSVLLVADSNTAFAAYAVRAELDIPNIQLYIYDNPALVPDETAVSRLLIAASSNATPFDALVSVGAGTLNDLTRYVSHKLGIPYYAVATAASMDGYTSSVAPLIIDGLKLTFPAHAPLGVIGDGVFMETAPAGMTAAGYGDMAGKWTSVNDWELEHIITGGSYCPVLAEAMRRAAADCLSCGADDTEKILNALLESGLVMQQAGHSKPASGSEHHLSHFWEMRALLNNRVPAPHGAKVGVATLMSLRASKWLMEEPVDFTRAYEAAERFDSDAWQADIRRVYGRAADGILRQWPDECTETKKRTLDAIRAQWETVIAVINRNLPEFNAVRDGLVRAGAPVLARDVGMDTDAVVEGVLHAQRIRPRFTVWRIADALGLLPEYAERLAAELT